MKKLLFLFVVLSFSLFAQNYFPLHIGNSYRYIHYNGSHNSHYNYSNKSINDFTITKDTLVNNLRYFYLFDRYMRYDSLSNKIYLLCDSQDTFLYDFNDTLSFNPNTCLMNCSHLSGVEQKDVSIFGQTLHSVGLFGSDGYNRVQYNWLPGLGLYSYNSHYEISTMGNTFDSQYLVEASIYQNGNIIHSVENYKPEFKIVKNDLEGNNLKFSLYIRHPLSDENLTSIFNYLDKVVLTGYYQKGNDVLPFDSIILSNNQSLIYNADIRLDSNYIKNGYTFYYKVTAKDKAWTPQYFTFPETGFLCKNLYTSDYKKYVPLHIGNSYLYLREILDNSGVTISKSVVEYPISKDTLINNLQYFMLHGNYVRYDSSSNIIYKLSNSMESPYFDFSNFNAIRKNGTVLGRNVSLIGGNCPDNSTVYFATDLGLTEMTTRESDGSNTSKVIKENILQAIVYGIDTVMRYTNANESDLQVLDSYLDKYVLKISVKASHPLSDSTLSVPFSYISKVALKGRYKRENSIIPVSSISFQKSSFNTYHLEVPLDTSKLTNGYMFEYNISAMDKGLMNNFVSYPDTGYLSLSLSDNFVFSVNLFQNYPNPFNPVTKVKYFVASESKVNITVYGLLGQKIQELSDGNKRRGNYEIMFNGAGLASGVYFVTIKASSIDGKKSYIQTKKMILMK